MPLSLPPQMKLIRYIQAMRELWADIRAQRKFNAAFLVPYVETLEKKHVGHFHTGQKEKIFNYYGLFIPAVLASSYKRLYQESFTEAERKRVTLFGILTPVGDDLFDIDQLDIEAIRTITYTPHVYKASHFTAKVACEIQDYLLNHVPDRNAYIDAAKNVFEIQIETIRQQDPLITDDEAERITYAKGGYSVIIYHEVMQKASDELREGLFYVGSLMQFANDLFDLHKDLPDGIQTLPARCKDFNALKNLYYQRCLNCNQKINKLNFDQREKEKFLIKMHFIISRGLVALDHFIKIENKKGMPLAMHTLTRKELITDMQKPGNIFNWLRYLYKMPES